MDNDDFDEHESNGNDSYKPQVSSYRFPKQRDYTVRWLKSIQYFYSFAMLGFVISSLGPLLLLLGEQVDQSHSVMNTLFTLRGAGYALASIVVGKVFDLLTERPVLQCSSSSGSSGSGSTQKGKLKKSGVAQLVRYVLSSHPFDTHYLLAHVFITISLVMLALLHFVLPLSTNFAMLAVVTVCIGAMSAILDMGGNVLIIRIWRDNVNPFMQTLHLAFGVGALVCPLLISLMMDALQWTMTTVYWVIALCIGTSAVLFIAIQCLLSVIVPIPLQRMFRLQWQSKIEGDNDVGMHTAVSESSASEMSDSGDAAVIEERGERTQLKPRSWWHRFSPAVIWNQLRKRTTIVAMFIGAAMFCIVGLEVIYGGMVYSFVVLSGMGTELDASLINSGYWIAFTVGRVASVIISLKLKPKTMLIMDIIGCILATVVLLTLSRAHLMFIWIGSILIGLSMASQFPCCIAFPVSEPRLAIREVSGEMTSIIVIGASLGEMFVPLMVSVLDLLLGLDSMLWTLLIVSITTTAIYLCAWLYILRAGEKIQDSTNQRQSKSHSNADAVALEEFTILEDDENENEYELEIKAED